MLVKKMCLVRCSVGPWATFWKKPTTKKQDSCPDLFGKASGLSPGDISSSYVRVHSEYIILNFGSSQHLWKQKLSQKLLYNRVATYCAKGNSKFP